MAVVRQKKCPHIEAVLMAIETSGVDMSAKAAADDGIKMSCRSCYQKAKDDRGRSAAGYVMPPREDGAWRT